MVTEWRGRKVTVVGAGVSGRGLALMASRLGASVFVTEKKAITPETRGLFDGAKIQWEENGHTPRAVDADVIVLSSGIPPQSDVFDLIASAKKTHLDLEVIGELDFVVPQIASLGSPIIAVTGSNGKSTVTALIGHMLKKAGRDVATGGNLGTAAADFTSKKFDAVVLELSSFQLARATQLGAKISVLTNFAPDHIDWHGSYNAYKQAKAGVMALRASDGWGIARDEDIDDLIQAGVGDLNQMITLSWESTPRHKLAGHIFMDMSNKTATLELFNDKTQRLFAFSDTTLLGRHNFENVAMSLATLHLFGVDIHDAVKLLEGFVPLPHRCANAGTVNGVLYVDDSKGTNVAASATAMHCIQGRKIIILGGQGKGEDYAPLAEAVCQEAEAAVVLGAETEPIAAALERANFKPVYKVKNMDEAVRKARDLASPGMTVLLSPACTSWDMYANYKERGVDFCRVVHEIEIEHKEHGLESC